MQEERSHSPQSVNRVMRVLEEVAATAEGISLADLSRKMDIPKSSLHALMRGLLDQGYLSLDGVTWGLGPNIYKLAYSIVDRGREVQLSDILREGLQRLAASTGETALFAVRASDGMSMKYVDLVESSSSLRFAPSVGDQRPLYATAGGRMLLAAGPESELDSYLKRLNPEKLTDATTIRKSELRNILTRVREAGIAQTYGEAIEGVTGTSAPVYDASGRAVGVVVLAVPTSRMNAREDLSRRFARSVLEEAANLSRNLGFKPSRP